MEWFAPRFTHAYQEVDVDGFNPFHWLDQRNDFDTAKKKKYQHSMLKQLKGELHRFKGSFMHMLKTGEEQNQLEDELHVQDGFLLNADSKPRGLCNPSDGFCGLYTAIQSTWWLSIKKVLPGFIQGFTKDSIEQLFTNHCAYQNDHRNMWAVCRDGSGFDSTQYSRVRRVVVNSVIRFLLD